MDRYGFYYNLLIYHFVDITTKPISVLAVTYSHNLALGRSDLRGLCAPKQRVAAAPLNAECRGHVFNEPFWTYPELGLPVFWTYLSKWRIGPWIESYLMSLSIHQQDSPRIGDLLSRFIDCITKWDDPPSSYLEPKNALIQVRKIILHTATLRRPQTCKITWSNNYIIGFQPIVYNPQKDRKVIYIYILHTILMKTYFSIVWWATIRDWQFT